MVQLKKYPISNPTCDANILSMKFFHYFHKGQNGLCKFDMLSIQFQSFITTIANNLSYHIFAIITRLLNICQGLINLRAHSQYFPRFRTLETMVHLHMNSTTNITHTLLPGIQTLHSLSLTIITIYNHD